MISIVVAARDMSSEKEIAVNLKDCGGEIIIVEGKNPSFQRNEGVLLAKGDIIYFADNDTVVTKDVFLRAEMAFENDKSLAVVGGPSITPDGDSFIQKTFSAVFASPWAAGKSSSRYRRAGEKRETDEKELILCNLFVRKEAFEKAGPFREDLYPNEENDFLNRAKAAGLRLVYDPDIYVERSQRKTFGKFMGQCFTYGRGRAEQTLIGFSKKDFINTVPAFFVTYLVYLAITGPAIEEMIPFILYLFGTLLFSIRASAGVAGIKSIPVIFMNFIILHLMYGAGFIYGLFRGIVIREKKYDHAIRTKIISG